jgi:hypothetical protein
LSIDNQKTSWNDKNTLSGNTHVFAHHSWVSDIRLFLGLVEGEASQINGSGRSLLKDLPIVGSKVASIQDLFSI